MLKWLRVTSPGFLTSVGLVFFAGLILVQGYLFMEQRRQTRDSAEAVAYSNLVIMKIETLLTKIKDAELGQRGYLLSGREDFLEPYIAAMEGRTAPDLAARMGNNDPRSIEELLADLQGLIAKKPEHRDDMNALSRDLGITLEHMAQSIDAHRRGNSQEAKALATAGKGKQLMDLIRLSVSQILERERQTLAVRQAHFEKVDRQFQFFMAAAGFITHAVLLVAFILVFISYVRMRQARHKLYIRDSDFRAAAEGSPDAFLLFRAQAGAKGRVRALVLEYLNPVAEFMTGFKREEAKGRTIEEILAQRPGASEDIKSAYIDMIGEREGHGQQTEYCAVSGPSIGRFFQEQAVPLYDGIAITCRDVTERKQVDKVKDELISTISHELRTPLTSIRGSLGLISGGLAGPLPEQAANLLTIAYNNCERLIKLVNDVLDIEKIESGRAQFDYQPVPLLPAIEQVILSNRAYAEKYHVSLRREGGVENGVVVRADRDRLLQVLNTLVSHAVKFSPPQGEIVVRCSLDTSNQARIDVVDSGMNIADEFRTRISQKFAILDNPELRQKGGTGLGLSIAKVIIEEMGGRIGFETEVGRGTSFYFTLPIMDQAP